MSVITLRRSGSRGGVAIVANTVSFYNSQLRTLLNREEKDEELLKVHNI